MRLFRKKKPLPETVDNSRDTSLELCYTDRMGNRYYRWKNPAAMATIRYLVGWQCIEYANMNLNPKEAIGYLDKIISANNSSNKSDVGYNAVSMKNRILKSDPERAYLELASCYVLMNNEIPKTYDTDLAAVKISIWQNDLEARAFFLNLSFQISKDLTSTSGPDTQNVSTAESQLQMMSLILSILKKSSSKDMTPSIV